MKNKGLLFAVVLVGSLASFPLHSQAKSQDKYALYEQAKGHYTDKDFDAALKLLNNVIPSLKGTQKEATALFYQAYCHFYKQQYLVSANQFKHFRSTFPRDDRVEEAMYMQGYALYLTAPDVKLEQTRTYEALKVFSTYFQAYPEGDYFTQATACFQKLREKLAEKAWLAAKLYYDLEHYVAAVVTLENFQIDFPASSLNERVAYLKVVAQQRFVMCSLRKDNAAQAIQKFMKYYHAFLEKYPESSYVHDLEKHYHKITSIQIDN